MKTEYDDRPELVIQHKKLEIFQVALQVLWTAMLITVLAVVVIDIDVAHEQRDRLLDCTTPEGKCFQEGQKRTGEAVESIVKGTLKGGTDLHLATRAIVVAAAFCSEQEENDTVKEIERCIKREMKLNG